MAPSGILYQSWVVALLLSELVFAAAFAVKQAELGVFGWVYSCSILTMMFELKDIKRERKLWCDGDVS